MHTCILGPHAASFRPAMPAPPLNGQVVGYAYLCDQQGAPLPNGQGQAQVLRDPLTAVLSYRFSDLAPAPTSFRPLPCIKATIE
jgi:hypothetical protein